MAIVDDTEPSLLKSVFWIASSKRDLQGLPKRIRRTVGQALLAAQLGRKHPDAKPLKGFGGAGVLEIVENDLGSTFRAVYTVRFAGVIYVLHVFQKKSRQGIRTPPEEIEKIKGRLKEAEKDYAEWVKKREGKDQP